MWSASDQPQERLSARGWRVGGVEDGRAHLKSFEYRKRIETDTLKSALKERKKKDKQATAGAENKTFFFFF